MLRIFCLLGVALVLSSPPAMADEVPSGGQRAGRVPPTETSQVTQLRHFRVAGGYRVTNPAWQVSLFLGPPHGNAEPRPDIARGQGHFCGGTRISPRFVLTAAHCLTDDAELKFSGGDIGVGKPLFHILADSTDIDQPGTVLQVVSAKIHPAFDPYRYTAGADIAVIEVTPTPSQSLGYVADQNASKSIETRTLTVYGWGYSGTNQQTVAMQLNAADLGAIPADECREFYRTDPVTGVQRAIVQNNTLICAVGKNAGANFCTGDSGGPLVGFADGRRYLVGVVSFIQGCGDKASPGVFTRVADYASWIDKVVGGSAGS